MGGSAGEASGTVTISDIGGILTAAAFRQETLEAAADIWGAPATTVLVRGALAVKVGATKVRNTPEAVMNVLPLDAVLITGPSTLWAPPATVLPDGTAGTFPDVTVRQVVTTVPEAVTTVRHSLLVRTAIALPSTVLRR